MKISIPFRTSVHAGLLTFLVFVISSFAGGMAKSAPSSAASVAPIQLINTNAGRVITAHAKLYEDKVYVAGLVARPTDPSSGAHVHVWGIDKNNHRVFYKTASVLVTGRPSFIHSESYVVSVDPALFYKAQTVYVTFHGRFDDESRSAD